MKNYCAVFFLATIALLPVVDQGSRLYGQNQKPAESVGRCSLDGPSVDETLKYINSAIPNDELSVQGKTLRSTYRFVVPVEDRSWHREEVVDDKAPIRALSCATTGRLGEGFYLIRAHCKHKNCVTKSFPTSNFGGQREDAIDLSFKGDAEHGERLAQALSHLIALLQQSHSDASDSNASAEPHP